MMMMNRACLVSLSLINPQAELTRPPHYLQIAPIVFS